MKSSISYILLFGQMHRKSYYISCRMPYLATENTNTLFVLLFKRNKVSVKYPVTERALVITSSSSRLLVVVVVVRQTLETKCFLLYQSHQ